MPVRPDHVQQAASHVIGNLGLELQRQMQHTKIIIVIIMGPMGGGQTASLVPYCCHHYAGARVNLGPLPPPSYEQDY